MNEISNNSVLVYKKYDISHFKELYFSLNSSDMPKILEGFLECYILVLANKENFEKLGMSDFSLAGYKKDIVKIFNDNTLEIGAIDNKFKSMLFKSNGESAVQELRSALTKDNKFLGFLQNLASTRLMVANADFNEFVCYLTSRYVSYYQHKGSLYIHIEDAAKSLEGAFMEGYHSVKCVFPYDYGWDSTFDWLTLLDSGRSQLYSSKSTKQQFFFDDFVFNLVIKQRYKRSERALAILREAQSNFDTTCQRVYSSQNFLSLMEKTKYFKELMDSFRRVEEKRRSEE